MGHDLLKRLFWAYSCQEHYSAPRLSLGELYEQIEDTDEASSRFSEALYATNLSVVETDRLDNMHVACFQAYELQGFINGFRLGKKLQEEAGYPAVETIKITDLFDGRAMKNVLDKSRIYERSLTL